MAKYLDEDGLRTLWGKINGRIDEKVGEAGGLSAEEIPALFENTGKLSAAVTLNGEWTKKKANGEGITLSSAEKAASTISVEVGAKVQFIKAQYKWANTQADGNPTSATGLWTALPAKGEFYPASGVYYEEVTTKLNDAGTAVNLLIGSSTTPTAASSKSYTQTVQADNSKLVLNTSTKKIDLSSAKLSASASRTISVYVKGMFKGAVAKGLLSAASTKDQVNAALASLTLDSATSRPASFTPGCNDSQKYVLAMPKAWGKPKQFNLGLENKIEDFVLLEGSYINPMGYEVPLYVYVTVNAGAYDGTKSLTIVV